MQRRKWPAISANELKVRYLWQPGDFNLQDNFFSRAIEAAGLKVKVIEDSKAFADLELVSVFPPRIRKLGGMIRSIKQNYPYGVLDYELKASTFKSIERGNCSRRIWYSGENIRPPLLEDFDYFFSFDQDDFGGRNYYLPLYFQEIGLVNFKNSVRVSTFGQKTELTNPREKSTRDKFACTFFSNPQSIRLAALKSLQSLGEVDVFGRAVKKPVRYKEEVAKNYKYVVCFENDLYPGYVTEKLVDAYKCGAVPIYWGDLGSDTNLNRESFINLKDFSSLHDLIEYLRNLSESEYFEIQKRPLLKKIPDISEIISILTNN